MKPAGNHQMEDQMKIVAQMPADTLAYSRKRFDTLTSYGIDRRVNCSYDKRATYDQRLNRLTTQQAIQGIYIQNDIGDFRHLMILQRAEIDVD